MSATDSKSADLSGKKIIFLQTMITDYRNRFFHELCKEFDKRDVHYEILTGTTYFYDELKNGYAGLPHTSIITNYLLLGRRVMFQRLPFREIIAAEMLFIEFNPRILSTWMVVFIRFVLGKRSVGWGHYFSRKGEKWFQNLIRRSLFSMIREFVTYSKRDQEIINREWPGKEIKVAFNSTNSRHDFELPKPITNCRDVIYTGRLIKEKKLDFLLRSIPLIIQSCDDFGVVHIVGSGPDEHRLKSLVEQYQIENHVLFHGHNTSVQFLQDLYNRSFCSISPGYVGLMAFQSHAHGRPTIVSPGEPNSPEFHMCEEGANAVFFESENERSLSNAVCEIYGNREYWSNLTKKIQEDCLKRYSIEAMVIPFLQFVGTLYPFGK